MKVAIFGYGLMGQRRQKVIEMVGDETIAVIDPMGTSWGTYDDVARADVIIIATPTPLLAATAAHHHNRKSVLIEKPCATSEEDLAQLQHVNMVPGYTLRHHEGVRRLKKWLGASVIGRPKYARMVYGHGGGATGWRRESGELLDQGSHLLDLGQHLFGHLTLHRAQLLNACNGDGAEDNVFLTCMSKDGVHIEMHASWTEWQPQFRVEVVCERGKLVLSGLGGAYGPQTLEVRGRRGELRPRSSTNGTR
jgi:predicted dehydrogenase